MRYGQIRQYDIANGPGIRTTIFVTGCTHGCKGCFNEEYQSFESGATWGEVETATVLDYLKSPQVEGLSLLGGEPFQNVEGLLPVLEAVVGAGIDKSVWAYSGYLYEQILGDEKKRALLAYCDVLVDGPFVEELRDPGLAFRGSKNQRIIDVKASMAKGEVQELHFD